ncbi:MAG: MBL fold metallo-hydrolase [Beijerinckiaceae bacterium]
MVKMVSAFLRHGLTALALVLLTASSPAWAQTAFPPVQQVQADPDERCLGPVARAPWRDPVMAAPGIIPAAFRHVQAGRDTRITFVGHSTFLIESPGGVTAATDYNDHVRPAVMPVVATMNRAHSTHFTAAPDPAIQHVLRGWTDSGAPARHDVQVGDMRVRNVATNIRDGSGATDYYGNSIFVFQAAGLCIAHLGHLHHSLSGEHLKALGAIDVVLVPVDGSWTLNIDGMIGVLKQINAPVMVPMHYFSAHSLNRFLDKAQASFKVSRPQSSTMTVTRSRLPDQPTIFVLNTEH